MFVDRATPSAAAEDLASFDSGEAASARFSAQGPYGARSWTQPNLRAQCPKSWRAAVAAQLAAGRNDRRLVRGRSRPIAPLLPQRSWCCRTSAVLSFPGPRPALARKAMNRLRRGRPATSFRRVGRSPRSTGCWHVSMPGWERSICYRRAAAWPTGAYTATAAADAQVFARRVDSVRGGPAACEQSEPEAVCPGCGAIIPADQGECLACKPVVGPPVTRSLVADRAVCQAACRHGRARAWC